MASKQIPEKFLDLLTGKKALASIATVMPDGSPQSPRLVRLHQRKIRITRPRPRKSEEPEVGCEGRARDNRPRVHGFRM